MGLAVAGKGYLIARQMVLGLKMPRLALVSMEWLPRRLVGGEGGCIGCGEEIGLGEDSGVALDRG